MSQENKELLQSVLDYFEVQYDKQTRRALNVACPFCSDSGQHCGIFFDTEVFNFSCWKCGAKGVLFDYLSELFNLSFKSYRELIENQFHTSDNKTALEQIFGILNKEEEEARVANTVTWPPQGSVPISVVKDDALVIQFLAKRKMSYDFCKKMSIHIGVTGRYTNRFLIPIFYEGRVVAYQGRDMTGKHKAKYLTEGDVSYFLYNYDKVDFSRPVAITEGVISSWAIDNSVASFTTALSDEQVKLMKQKNPPMWVLCWDIGADGSDAFWKGRKEVKNLAGLLGSDKVAYIELPHGHDPDSLGKIRMAELLKDPIGVSI